MKIFLIDGQAQYDSFSIGNLEELFAVKKPEILKVTSKLIIAGNIAARIDLATGCVIFEKQASTVFSNDRQEIEHLQIQYLDKIKNMVDTNERCMDLLIN